MTTKILKRIAVFNYKMAEILFVGVVIGGVMQATVPTWKVLVGGALSIMTFVIAVGFDMAGQHQTRSRLDNDCKTPKC